MEETQNTKHFSQDANNQILGSHSLRKPYICQLADKILYLLNYIIRYFCSKIEVRGIFKLQNYLLSVILIINCKDSDFTALFIIQNILSKNILFFENG